jgi:hypothetical protein
MLARVLDIEATRAELRGELVKAEAAASRAADVAADVALYAAVETVTRCELEAAMSAQMAADARAAELRRALDALGARAADPTASAGVGERQAAARRLAELTHTCNAAGARVVQLADELAAACMEGLAAAGEAATIGERQNLNVAPLKYWCESAARVVYERSHPSLPASSYQGRTEDLARSVRQLCGVEAMSQV